MNRSYRSDGNKWCQGSDVGGQRARASLLKEPPFVVRFDRDIHDVSPCAPKSEAHETFKLGRRPVMRASIPKAALLVVVVAVVIATCVVPGESVGAQTVKTTIVEATLEEPNQKTSEISTD